MKKTQPLTAFFLFTIYLLLMVNEAHKHNNRKSNGQNYVSRNKSTKASPPVANANVVINVDNAKQKLQELKSVYQQKVNFADTRGFLTDLRTALGIPNDRGASKYGVVKGGNFVASISLTNHNSNAQTYVDANANYPYNLRLMIRRRYRKNTFKPHPSVNLEEYVYFWQEMVKCTKGNPYLLIIDGIIEFLSKGQYEDKTGIAHKNQSSIITESKINKRIETWYRGFDKEYGVYGEETPHLLWLTTDLNYAKEYGDSIMEYKIDMSKCHGSIDGMGYLFNFDMSEGPSEEYATYLLNEYGVNSYRYYGGLTESSYCMCLWDKKPIVSQRILENNELNESKDMKKNVVKINENTLRQIVAESVKKVLNEYAEGNEMSPIPGENYSPTPESLIQTIIETAKYIDEFRGKAERCIRQNDTECALTSLRKIGYSADVILDRANELQGFIESDGEGKYY